MLELDYKVIKLLYQHKKPMKIGEISKQLNVPHSTLGSCVTKRLNVKGFVKYKAYHDVVLTEKGKDLAKELNRHSRLLELLLYNELGISSKIAHEESEKFNLLLSCETINKICNKYGHPNKCPCGELISNSSECYCEKGHH
jgi:DtxR family Mn-dependent transcriptional regulator